MLPSHSNRFDGHQALDLANVESLMWFVVHFLGWGRLFHNVKKGVYPGSMVGDQKYLYWC